MNRARVGILVLLSLILLVRERLVPAGLDDGRAAALDGVSRGALRADSAIDVPDVAGIVTRANPELSSQERNRIATAVLRLPQVRARARSRGGRDPGRERRAALGKEHEGRRRFDAGDAAQDRTSLGLPGNAATIESNVEAGCAILAENIERLGEDRGILAYFWGGDIRGDAYLVRVEAARPAAARTGFLMPER